MDELVSVDLTEVIELPSTGVQFFQTNLVTKTSNYKGVTGSDRSAYLHLRSRRYLRHQPGRTERHDLR